MDGLLEIYQKRKNIYNINAIFTTQFYDGAWHDVWKKPKDITKASKRGRLALIKENGKFKTIREEELGDKTNYLETVFENGKLLKEYTFEEVRANAKV